jgi:hypothetical protein
MDISPMSTLAVDHRPPVNPLDRIEELAESRDWSIERQTNDEVNLVVEANWGTLQVSLSWREDIEGLHLAGCFDFKVPLPRREEVGRLLNMINEQLYLGHFDLWRHDGSVVFRNGLTLAGGAEANEAQCEALITLALDACERYFPAFQFVIWAGKTAEQAIEASLLETMGEA